MAVTENITYLATPRQADPVLALYGEWASLRARSETDPTNEAGALLAKADAVECEIWATPATSLAGLLCKARVAEDWAKSHEHNQPGIPFEDLDWHEKAATWLRQDIERLASLPRK